MSKYNMNYSLGGEEFSEKLGNFLRSLLAEFLGTFALLFFGVATCTSSPGELLPIAIGFGLTLTMIIAMVGHVSGAHLNPAVSIALLIVGRLNLVRAVFYIVIQAVAAIFGSYILHLLSGSDLHEGHTRLKTALSPAQGFFFEFLGTLLLMLVILGSVDAKKDLKPHAPLIIGLAVTVDVLTIGKYTGSSLNPARTLGTAVISNNFSHHWIYWVAPILGACVGSVTYIFLFEVREEED